MMLNRGMDLRAFETGLREASEALGRFLLETRAQESSPSFFRSKAPLRFALTAVVLGAAIALKLALGSQHIAFPGTIFFPAILLCVLFAGWQYGLAAWAVSTLVVWLTQGNGADSGVVVFAVSGAAQVAIASFARAMLLDREIHRHRLLRLVDASQGFVFVTDGNGHPLEPNTHWAALTGMSWDDYRGRGWVNAVHPDDREKLALHGSPKESKAFHLELRIRDGSNGEWRWHRMRTLPSFGHRGEISEWIGTLRDIHERKLEREKRDLVTSEMRHRLKNLMAIVEALAKYSAPRAGTNHDIDEFLKRFSGRLHALTAASDMVLAGKYVAVEANAIIAATLAPFTGDLAPRFRIEGPELRLSEEFGGGLAMAVHELATNAIKYGALSVPQGRVSFVWSAEQRPEGERVIFDWKERDGPTAPKPNKEGFGSRMIRSVTARENDGAVSIDYEPDGLHCRIAFTRSQAGQSA